MRSRVLFALALALLWNTATYAQQIQPLTFVSDYYVRPGKEDEFMNLVKTVGAPVRDKLMAEGVVLAWGVDVPLMRAPGSPTHSIWYDVADWDGLQKVQTAMGAQLAKLADEDKKAAEEARKKGGKAPKSTAERIQETLDTSRTRDWVFRGLFANFGSAPPPAGLLPFTRIFLITIKPGKYQAWRAAWDKYNKPILDKLVADGVVGAYGIGTEEVRTSGDFTHYAWVSVPNLSEKVRSAFIADRGKRSAEENEHILHTFDSLTDPNAARSFVLRAVIFKVAAPPKK